MWRKLFLAACVLLALCHFSEARRKRKPVNNCIGRCSNVVNPNALCQCNPKCHEYSNCCLDKERLCGPAPTRSPSPSSEASFNELSRLFTTLWGSDTNGVNITVNYQGRTNSSNKADMAQQPLFRELPKRIRDKRTYKTFFVLLDNYNHRVGQSEDRLQAEKNEENEFLDAILSTTVMAKTHDFLKRKGLVSSAKAGFKNKLREMWFNTYTRSKGVQDTSGFEHVFVGELKHGSVTGLHSWLQFYNEERHNRLNYMGWIYKKKHGILGLKFKWLDKIKPISTIQVGPSPEFDIAVLSTCFLVNPPRGNCQFKIGKDKLTIKVYKVNNSPTKIGSAFLQ